MLTEEELEQMVTKMIDRKEDPMEELYCEYCKELDQYDTQTHPEGSDRKVFLQYKAMNGCDIREINKDGNAVGFLITLVRPYDKGTLFIAEAYIKPGYRGRGYMREAFKDALRGGDYSMIRFMVFDGNKAIDFWKKLMREAGYKCMAQDKVVECLQEYFYAKAV